MPEYVEKSEFKQYSDKIELENKFQNERLNKLEKSVEQIHSLTVSVEKMAVSVESMAQELKSQGVKLSEIEKKPAQNWDKLVWVIVTALVGIALGAIAMFLGLK